MINGDECGNKFPHRALCLHIYVKIVKNKICVEIKSGMSIISDKMDGALLGVGNINHKYIVVERRRRNDSRKNYFKIPRKRCEIIFE